MCFYVTLTFEHPGAVQELYPPVFLEYISCPEVDTK